MFKTSTTHLTKFLFFLCVLQENNNHQHSLNHQSHPHPYGMDHTFHTPSFGDEDFNIPTPYQAGQHAAIDHHHQQQQQQQYQMPQEYQQWHHHHEAPPMYGMPQHSYPAPNNNMHGGMPPPHMNPQMQQQAHISPQHNFVQSPPPEIAHGPSPHGENGTSEDSDDTIPVNGT